MSESLTTTSDGRAMLRMERRLAHPPAKVWRAITEPDHLSRWFPMTVVAIDLRVGGALRLDLGTDPHVPGDSFDDLPITEVDPPQLFEFNWQGEVLRWELTPADEGCLLVFTHTFDDRAGAASFASGWEVCIDAMENVLDGEPIPDAQPSAELHDAYVDTFGLDVGTIDTTEDGWQVRFERQLTAPAHVAWSVLTGDAVDVGAAPPPSSFTADAAPPARVTTVEAPNLLEYTWQADGGPAGHVRWEMRDENGTGHGARLVVTQSGGAETKDHADLALRSWPAPIRQLAERLRTRA
ncbi:SRPBCC family protein [Phytoactinopolyspora halotolerans]|uniref:Toxin-antitoxin system toxin subunit n=1 Tax=Phytoactinopolyspora halotolerans TaxID=1981512 RepID=A0A6L9SEE7_9ACTN|nr:SRPBCC family protein [Phytoactinopolyspora halotolerans]NEE02948.1 toxin-antitoxin system toxin subunit [Phytoactinopolyspora halotolerans]